VRTCSAKVEEFWAQSEESLEVFLSDEKVVGGALLVAGRSFSIAPNGEDGG